MTALGRLCESNPRVDGQPWEDWEGNGPCQDCGTRNVIWFTDNATWNLVCDPDRGLIVCPTCFIIRAHKAGVGTIWKLVLDDKQPGLWCAMCQFPDDLGKMKSDAACCSGCRVGCVCTTRTRTSARRSRGGLPSRRP